jgi:diaminopimelate decarboxylase
MRDLFAYRSGALHCDGVALAEIAAKIPTPFYCYAAGNLRANFSAFREALRGLPVRICFAVKANANQAVLKILAAAGAGADIVSGGELVRALAAGITPSQIVFSGVGKTDAEITAALQANIHQFNVESLPELEAISRIATALNLTAPVALRVNPDVDPKTHAKISTGQKETKFGIELEQLEAAIKLATTLPGLKLVGLAMHIGSQLTDLTPCRDALLVMADLVKNLRAKGVAVERLDLGGGFAIRYDNETVPPLADYAQLLRDIIVPLGCDLAIEPGRAMVGNAGVLVSRVIFAKPGIAKKFLIIDAAMNDLVRPAMYDAWHSIVPVRETPASTLMPWDVVGPVCETSDLFGCDRMLPDMQTGDLVAILDAGAYGSSMASTYNARPLTPEVLVDGTRFALTRRPIDVHEQMSWEELPDWL